MFERFDNLTHLTLQNWCLDDISFEKILALKKLKSLDITACHVLDVSGCNIEIANITTLILRRTNISSQLFCKFLNNCKKIESLDIPLCLSLDDYCFENIKLLRLQHLDIAYISNLSDKAMLSILRSCQQYCTINVTACLSLNRLSFIEQEF